MGVEVLDFYGKAEIRVRGSGYYKEHFIITSLSDEELYIDQLEISTINGRTATNRRLYIGRGLAVLV